jgi:hypothetical protein
MPFDPDAFLQTMPPQQPTPAFDPDAYLAQPSGAKPFDPDAYLGIKPAAAAPPPSNAPTPLTMAKAFGQGYGAQVGTTVAGTPTVLEMLRGGGAGDFQQQMREEQLGPEGLATEARSRAVLTPQFQKAGKEITEGIQKALPTPKEQEGLTTDVFRGFGSVGANIATGLIGGPVGAAGGALAGGAGEAQQMAAGKGQSQEMQDRVAAWGTIPGATDLIDYLLPQFGGAGKLAAVIGHVGARAFKGAVTEAFQEGGQQGLQNLIAKWNYDPNISVWEDVPRSALIGAIVGGGTSAVLGHKGETEPQPAPSATPSVAPVAPAAPQIPVGLPGVPPTEAQVLAGLEGIFASPVVSGMPVAAALASSDQPIGVGVPLDVQPQTIEVPITTPAGTAIEPQADQAGAQAVREDQAALGTQVQGKLLNAQGVEIPGGPDTRLVRTFKGTYTVPTVHSTTMADIIPTLSTSHFSDKPASAMIMNALKQRLVQLAPDQAIHFVNDATMNNIGYSTAAGVYLSTATTPGPILIRASALKDQAQGSYLLMHEAVHAVTSMVMHNDPVVAQRSVDLMNEAMTHLPPKPPGESRLVRYWTTNEREFIAEAFSNSQFQYFLAQHHISKELADKLGLQEKPTLWQAFVDMVRNALGLPKTKQVMSLLEATMKVGLQTMQTQQTHLQAMQKKFNKIDPGLTAVPKQAETKGLYDMISGLNDYMPNSEVREEFARQAGYADKINVFYKYMLHAYQLGELNPKLAPFQRYLEKMRAAAVDESRWNDAAMKIMKDWENVGRQQSERVIDFIDDITNMVYRTQAEVKAKIGRKPSAAELQVLVQKHGLNNAGINLVAKINTLFDGFLDASAQLAIAEANKITDPAQRATAVAAVQANVASLKSRPYFPFMRYGRHVVVVKNAAGHIVHREHFERRGLKSAEKFQKEALVRAQKAFPSPQYSVEIDLLSETSAPMVGMSNILLGLMQQKLNLTQFQLKALEQLKFELSPAQSFKHRFQHKNYVKGYSRDFQRSFAQYFFHGAKWYAKVKYADGMRQDIADVKNGTMTSLTPTKRVQLSEFMEDHIENNFLNPSQDSISFKAGLVFFTLAYTPVSAVVNMSQTPMVTLPFLAAKFGPVTSARAISGAITKFQNYYRKGTITGMTGDDAKAMDYAIQTGRLDQTLAAELAAWGQGSNLGVGYGGGAIRRNMHGAVQKGMWMFSIAEKWNRRVAFMAARDLALRQPNNKFAQEALTRYHDEYANMLKSGFTQEEASAILVASHVVDQTQFMATPEARPRFMRGKLGTLFLYKRFIQGLMFLTLNNKRDFMPWFIIVAMGLGGLAGVPGYEDIKEIAKALGWMLFGKDFDLDREVRKLVKEMTDENWAADQILHGSSRLGFGVPWLLNMLGNAAGQSPTVNMQTGQPQGPDLSASMSNTILPVKLGKLFGPPIGDPSKAFGEAAAEGLGVVGGLAYNMYKSVASKDEPGDFKRWELAMPRAAKNLTHAYRAYSEGMERGSTGAAIIRYDVRDPEHMAEIIALAGGFQPRRLTAKWEELREQSEVLKFYDVQRGMILQQWTAAVKAGKEPEEMEKMRLATQEFNANLPYEARGMKLTSDTINQSVKTRLKSQELQEGGLAAQRGKIPIIQEIQRLHPEAIIDVRKAR